MWLYFDQDFRGGEDEDDGEDGEEDNEVPVGQGQICPKSMPMIQVRVMKGLKEGPSSYGCEQC